MNTDDVKDMAQKAGDKAKSLVQDDSPIQRFRDAAEQVDGTVRDFAKAQPVMALVLALGAGYLFGRAVARAT